MKQLFEYIFEKSLEDELIQLEKIRNQISDYINDIKKNPAEYKQLFNSDGELNYSFIGARAILPLKLLAKICKRHNIGAYIVKYKGYNVYIDYSNNKPFYIKNGKKNWLKADVKVTYLDDTGLNSLSHFEPMDLDKYI